MGEKQIHCVKKHFFHSSFIDAVLVVCVCVCVFCNLTQAGDGGVRGSGGAPRWLVLSPLLCLWIAGYSDNED